MPNAPQLLLSKIPKIYRITTASEDTQLRVRWIDFDLGAFDLDYPQVNHLLFRLIHPERLNAPAIKPELRAALSLIALPWDRVQSVDWSTGLIQIGDHSALQPMEAEVISKSVLIVRDILDAYVIDLQNRRLTRANDLLLSESQGLRLVAVDTSARALLRRLSGGHFRGFSPDDLQDWKYVEFLRGDPSAVKEGAFYHRRIEHLPPGEIASLLEALPYLHAAELVSLLPSQLAADSMELLTYERQLQVFEELDETYALPILERMAPDIATDLIGRLSTEQARYYLDRLPRTSSKRIIDLLRFPENTVGGIMTNDVIAIPGDLTIAEARERLRTSIQKPDFVYFLYVVDDDEHRRLRGVVTLRNILVARDDQRLTEIMNPYLETLAPLDPPRQAAYRVIRSQLAALPVATSDGRLLGAVTVDSAVSLVAPGTWSTQAPRIFS